MKTKSGETMNFFKKFITQKTDETTYKFELIRFAILLMLMFSHDYLVFHLHFDGIPPMISAIIVVCIYIGLLLSLIRLSCIADNISKLKRLSRKRKYRWVPLEIALDDFLQVLSKLDVMVEFDFSHDMVKYALTVYFDDNTKSSDFELNDLAFSSYSDFERHVLTTFATEKAVLLFSIDNHSPTKYWPKISRTKE